MPILICKQVRFYSQGDESAFFSFARGIKGVRKIRGVSDEIHLHVSARISEASLRDLLGLFRRYKIAMQQLSQFETVRNREWFRDEQQFWYQQIFDN